MKYKMACFDLDHTLYETASGTVYQEDINALHALRKQGVIITAATGRPLHQIDKVLAQVDFDYLVLLNGSCVMDYEQHLLYDQPIAMEDIEDLIRLCITYDDPLCLDFIDVSYLYTGLDVSDLVFTDHNLIEHLYKSKDRTYHLDHHVYNAFLKMPNERLRGFLKKHPNLTSDAIMQDYYDVYPITSNKAHGIQILLDKFQISWDEVIAFGDSSNDIEMLKCAGLSIAMATASDDIKNLADIVCPSTKDHGIAKSIEKLLHDDISRVIK